MLKDPHDEGGQRRHALEQLGDVVGELLRVRSHAGFDAVLRSGLQKHIPHQILLSAWGDFRLGVVHYDLHTAAPELQAANIEAGALAPTLNLIFQRWMVQGRAPLLTDTEAYADAWSLAGVDAAMVRYLGSMKSMVIHGIQDQRGRNDCLYLFLAAEPMDRRTDAYAVGLLMPYIDVAMRQLSIKPRVAAPTTEVSGAPIAPAQQDPSSRALTEREIEIMQWVMQGRSNEEIGQQFNLSTFTVKTHMQRIYEKLDVFNRSQAIAAFKSIYAANQ